VKILKTCQFRKIKNASFNVSDFELRANVILSIWFEHRNHKLETITYRLKGSDHDADDIVMDLERQAKSVTRSRTRSIFQSNPEIPQFFSTHSRPVSDADSPSSLALQKEPFKYLRDKEPRFDKNYERSLKNQLRQLSEIQMNDL